MQNGIRLGRDSTVLGSGSFRISASGGPPEGSLEIWLQPRRIWDSGTLVAFRRPGDLFRFSLQQAQTDLLVRTSTPDDQYHPRTASLRVKEVFRKPGRIFLTITTGPQGVLIYVNGVPAGAQSRLPASIQYFDGGVVLGDSPGQNDSWRGDLFGFAIYDRQLEAAQVLRNFAAWKQPGNPILAEADHNLALYLFDEHAGNLVHDYARSGVDLSIPETYQVVDKLVLEPFWTEFSMTRSYGSAAIKNIVGFIPFGFCFYAWLSPRLSAKHALLATAALGTATSFTIEILQAFLPTRESGTTDLITNTFGTCIGLAAYRLLAPVLIRWFPWAPLRLPRT